MGAKEHGVDLEIAKRLNERLRSNLNQIQQESKLIYHPTEKANQVVTYKSGTTSKI
jgi:hypothetical protein